MSHLRREGSEADKATRLIAAGSQLLRIVCEMLGAAEVDLLDEKSNVWRSLMIDARAAISDVEGDRS